MIRIVASLAAGAVVMAAQAQAPVNPEIQSVVSELATAWNDGGQWTIAALRNTPVPAAPIVR